MWRRPLNCQVTDPSGHPCSHTHNLFAYCILTSQRCIIRLRSLVFCADPTVLGVPQCSSCIAMVCLVLYYCSSGYTLREDAGSPLRAAHTVIHIKQRVPSSLLQFLNFVPKVRPSYLKNRNRVVVSALLHNVVYCYVNGLVTMKWSDTHS